MLRGIHTSTSGLVLNQRRLAISAHNTANLRTADAAKLRVRAREAPQGGVEAGTTGSQAEIRPVEEAVEQMVSAQHFVANARAVQTQDDMLGALLDLEA